MCRIKILRRATYDALCADLQRFVIENAELRDRLVKTNNIKQALQRRLAETKKQLKSHD